MSDCFFTPKQLAQRWAMTEQTLANWRSLNKGPPFIRISNRVLYPQKDILAHEEHQNQLNKDRTNHTWPILEH